MLQTLKVFLVGGTQHNPKRAGNLNCLYLDLGDMLFINPTFVDDLYPVEMYFCLDNSEIKGTDLCILTTRYYGGEIKYSSPETLDSINSKGMPGNGVVDRTVHKIVASTDNTLKFPLIPFDYLNMYRKRYNKGDIIKKIHAEMKSETEFETDDNNFIFLADLKTITDQRKVYSQDEMATLCRNLTDYILKEIAISYPKEMFHKVTEQYIEDNVIIIQHHE